MTDATPTPPGNRESRLAAVIASIEVLERGLANVRTELAAVEGRVTKIESTLERLLGLASHTDSRLRHLEAKIIGGTGVVFAVVEVLVAIFHHLNK